MNADIIISPVDGLKLSLIYAEPTDAVQAMKDRGYENVSLKIYPGLLHEIHNETHHEEVWADILSYLAHK